MRHDPFELGSVIAGKYRLDGFLASGGMGAVFQATNITIGRKVALKLLTRSIADRPDVKRRFRLEAQAAAVIAHPGIVDVLDMGETEGGQPFIVMELLEGASLRALLKRLGPFTAAQAVAVIDPVLDALAAAHDAGVIHRDVKPANIFVCLRPQRAIKLLDFGVSRFEGSTGLTNTGTTLGTPKYMSPEQVLGEKGLGPAADLYSVGAVLYHLLTGHPPFEADSDIGTLARTLTAQHQPLGEARPDLDPTFCREIDRLLARAPTERPRDARELRATLASLVPRRDDDTLYTAAAAEAQATTTPPRATPHPPSRPFTPAPFGVSASLRPREAPPPLPRRRVAAVIIVALLLGAGLAAWLRAQRQPRAPTPPQVTAEAIEAPAPAPQPIDLVPVTPTSTSLDAGRAVTAPKRRPSGLNIQERNPYQ